MFKKVDYFGINFFSICGFTFFFFLPAVVVDDDGYHLAFIVATVGLLCYMYGLQLKYKLKINQLHPLRGLRIIAIMIITYNYYLALAFISSDIEVISYTEKYLNVNYIKIYGGIIKVLFEFLIYYILVSFVGCDRKKYIIVFLSCVVANLKSDTRLDLILPIIFWIGYGYYFHFIKITMLRVLCVFVLSPIVFTFLLLKRVMKGSFDSYFDQISTIYEYLNMETLLTNVYVSMETFRSYEIFIKIINDSFIHVESGFIRLVFMPIPRSVWPGKPESVSRIISYNYFPEQYFGGGGTVANIFGDGYINGGIIGVIIVLFFWGAAGKIIYNSTIKSIRANQVNVKQKSFLICFYLLYLLECVQYFRGFMSESFWKLIYLFFITMMISHFLKTKSHV